MKSDLNVKTLPHDVPTTLRTVLRRCLEKDPRERLRDIGDVRLAMQGAVRGAGQRLTGGRARAPTQLAAGAATGSCALVLGSIGTGIAVWTLTRAAPTTSRVTRFPILLPPVCLLGCPVTIESPFRQVAPIWFMRRMTSSSSGPWIR